MIQSDIVLSGYKVPSGVSTYICTSLYRAVTGNTFMIIAISFQTMVFIPGPTNACTRHPDNFHHPDDFISD